ncbi:MAG: tandem-95 repeat protein [Pseudomonadales bacterium]|nr:tandem-95 repeat protein [Pseudomonadales bacterium]
MRVVSLGNIANGQAILNIQAETVTFIPDASYVGEATFEYFVSGGADIALGKANINVGPTSNTAPLAVDDEVVTIEDASVVVNVINLLANDSDVEGDSLSIFSVLNAVNGGVVFDAQLGEITFTPNANYHGPASFDYEVSDGTGSSFATVNITVNSVNDAPTPNWDKLNWSGASEGAIFNVNVFLENDFDTEGDSIAFVGVSNGQNVNMEVFEEGQNTYVEIDLLGLGASFDYTVSDGVDTSTATVYLNPQWLAQKDVVVADQDTPLVIDGSILLANDHPAYPGLSITDVRLPQHGAASLTAEGVLFEPEPGYSGLASFEYIVSDGVLSDYETVTVMVLPVNNINDAPMVLPPSALTLDMTPLGEVDEAVLIDSIDIINQYVVDPEGDPLAIASVSASPAGTTVSVNQNTGVITYQANGAALYNLSQGFEFTVSDGEYESKGKYFFNLAPYAIESGTSSPIVFFEDSFTVAEDESLSISVEELLGNDTHLEGRHIEISGVSNAQNGVVTLDQSSGMVIFTPGADYNGDASFEYTVSDGLGTKSNIVSVDIAARNDAPKAQDDQVFANQTNGVIEISTSDLLANDMDVDGDTLSVLSVLNAVNGSVALDSQTKVITFTPNINFTGTSSFDYLVGDAQGADVIASVSIVPAAIFSDNFEADNGWIINPNVTDTATRGQWEMGHPEPISYDGKLSQLGFVGSGDFALITGTQAGAHAGDYDLDGGVTSIISPEIQLPEVALNEVINLSFSHYQTHLYNASSGDFLRVTVQGESESQVIFEKTGADFLASANAAWEQFSSSLNAFAGKTISILIEASDHGSESYVEAGIDDIHIEKLTANTVFEDAFEADLGWVVNPDSTDNATGGQWERGAPEMTQFNSVTMQLGAAASGLNALITGLEAGYSAGSNDIDLGTSIRSQLISLPEVSGTASLGVSFNYYFSQYSNATSADYFRITAVSDTKSKILFEQRGNSDQIPAKWHSVQSFHGLDEFSGEDIYLLVEAADNAGGQLLEAGLDDLKITRWEGSVKPSIMVDSTNPSESTFGGTITLIGSAWDNQGRDISQQIEWVSDKSGVVGSGATVDLNGLYLGTHNIAVRVIDAEGYLSVENVEFTLNAPAGALVGSETNETIYGGYGSDLFLSGGGNDLLYGQAGDDRFVVDNSYAGYSVYNGGDGFDSITGGLSDDRIELRYFSPTHSVERIDGGQGINTIKGYYATGNYLTLDFSATELLNIDEIQGTPGIDSITGSSSNDELRAFEGFDTLSGGSGSDTYHFSSGDGSDTIKNYAADAEIAVDRLLFEDFDRDELWLHQQGDDLVVNHIGSDDRVYIEDWFLSAEHQLDEIYAGDQILLASQVDQLVQAMATISGGEPANIENLTAQHQEDLSTALAVAWQ